MTRNQTRKTLKGRSVSPKAIDEVEHLLNDGSRDRQYLIEYLHLIQDHFGHLSAEHLVALARLMSLSQAEVYEVASFYHHFDIVKEGQAAPPVTTVRICETLSCAQFGAAALLEQTVRILGPGIPAQGAGLRGLVEDPPQGDLGQ